MDLCKQLRETLSSLQFTPSSSCRTFLGSRRRVGGVEDVSGETTQLTRGWNVIVLLCSEKGDKDLALHDSTSSQILNIILLLFYRDFNIKTNIFFIILNEIYRSIDLVRLRNFDKTPDTVNYKLHTQRNELSVKLII